MRDQQDIRHIPPTLRPYKPTEKEPLFRQPGRAPMVPTAFAFRFKKILEENGLSQNLSVHSLLIAQGVDVRTVAGLLGHSQPSTTTG